MYTLYFVASITTFYYLYSKIKKFLTVKSSTFEDLKVNNSSTILQFLDITYEDYTREFIENVDNFEFILTLEKPIKYAVINYSIDYISHSILFSKENLTKLVPLQFPLYDNIVKMPLYREVERAVIIVNDIEYDITDIILNFAGPKLNYHLDIVNIRFEEIIDYSQEFPELLNVEGIINIYDNFKDKHVYNYPGEFTWKENLLN